MKSEKILLYSGIGGIIAFAVLPSFLKIFAFLIPAIALSTVFHKKFNWTIFLTLILLFILFPSSLLTMDASSPINLRETSIYLNDVMTVLTTVFAIIIPTIGLMAGIYALTQGKVDQGISAITKAVASTTIIGVMLFFGTMLGWNLGIESLKPAADWMWNAIVGVVDFFHTAMVVVGIEDPDALKEMDNIELLSVIDSPKTLNLTIASIYPLIISVVDLVLALIHFATNIRIKKIDNDDKTQQFNRPGQQDLSFVVFLIIIIVISFVLFLTYTFESFMNYQTIGFFSIYLIITSVSCILLAMGIGSPTKNTKETILGVIIGVSILFLYANMFTQTQTLDLMSVEYQNLTSIRILNQFLFVAPTESLLFHVFLPSLVVYYYLQQNKVLTQDELLQARNNIDIKIETYQIAAELHKETNNTKNYVKTMKKISDLKLKKHKLSRLTGGVDPGKLSDRDFIIFLVYCLAFNVVFAILHWFKSELSFEIFWSSGIGFLYLSSGMILTLISYRYGWLSGILAHAIHNSLTLFLIYLMTGI